MVLVNNSEGYLTTFEFVLVLDLPVTFRFVGGWTFDPACQWVSITTTTRHSFLKTHTQ